MASGKTDWMDEGLAVLAEEGAPALTLDRLCQRMALTKGAFYHHFGSMPRFRTALLEHFEEQRTTAVIEAVEATQIPSGRDRLLGLLDTAVRDRPGPDLETAVRAWAKQDPEAAAVQQRVDARRIAYLRSLCAAAGHPAPDRLATAIYVMLIGAAHLTPPLPKAELQELYRDLVLPLIDAPALPTTER
jgi:AcrR family transcriptional regulator